MAKSRREIQKAYRERQKAKGPKFLDTERLRQRRYYVPAGEISERKRTERNSKAKLRNRLSRLRKKERSERELHNMYGTSGYESFTGTGGNDVNEPNVNPGPSRLIVKLAVKSNENRTKKLNSKLLSRAKKNVNSLKSENKSLRKVIKTKNRKLQRMATKIKRFEDTRGNDVTPIKETEAELRVLNLTPRRSQKIKKKLIVSNTILEEISAAKGATSVKKRQNLHRLISGKIAKKYRCITRISKETGFCRRSLGKVDAKNILSLKERRDCLSRKVQTSVEEFLCRDDNSRLQPGKADAKKLESGEKCQTRVLTDYMKNLHDKYLSENPNGKISLTTFQRLRPKNILLTSFISRNTCQCIHHQNMALKVQAIRKAGIKISQNPEKLVPQQDSIDTLLEDLPDKMVYKVWKKVEIENGKMRMKVIEQESEAKLFRLNFKQQLGDFAQHVSRVHEQYEQIRRLKENLPEKDIILQMDFAENFACRSLDEIQTAYWNQSMVTLHPVVCYYKDGGELKHQSFVVVSDEMSHSSSTVCAFLDHVIPSVKLIRPNIDVIHYWTDSPSSQYRNRFIFDTVANHKSIYGTVARWNYFEVDHGKGPCDGLGGTTKRMADEAVKQGNALIQGAAEFFKWASESAMKNVKFLFVSKEETKIKQETIKRIITKALRGTMKLHAVGMTENNKKLMTRETSCYCELCLSGGYCHTWQSQYLNEGNKLTEVVESENNGSCLEKTEVKGNTVSVEDGKDSGSQEKTIDIPEGDKVSEERKGDSGNQSVMADNPIDALMGKFVAAVYDGGWYIGQVEDKDVTEDEVEVNFMVRAKTLYKWPENADRIWISRTQILSSIETLVPSGKSKRLYRLSKEESEQIENLFAVANLDN